MKITAFNGSPWGRRGHTHVMVEEFLLGAHEQGANFEQIQLAEKQIKPCIGCMDCFYRTPGKCIFKDDMEDLIEKFLTSDVVVFATPFYMDNVSTLMKTFMDRLIPTLEPHYEKDSSGQYRRGIRHRKHPKFVVISSCVMPEQNQFKTLRFFFRRFARSMHTEIVAEIYLTDAGLLLLCERDTRLVPMVDKYKELLRSSGKEFVTAGRISAETAKKLRSPMISADEYVRYANDLWDMILPKKTILEQLTMIK